MLRAGSAAAAISDSRSRQPLWREFDRRVQHLGVKQVSHAIQDHLGPMQRRALGEIGAD
jgi:hypothetical protein